MTAPTLAPPAASTAGDLAFTVEAKAFATACAAVARRLPAKPQTPVLAGTLLVVEGDTLMVAAFDYDVSAQAHLAVEGAAPGRALVSGKLLADLTKTFPAKPVDVTLEGTQVAIRCGRIEVTLPAMPVEDYPTLPGLPPAIGTVDPAAFVALVERVAPMAGTDETLASLMGAQLSLSGARLTLTATNRYQAAQGSIAWRPGQDWNPGAESVAALIPASVLTDIARVLADETGPVALHLDAGPTVSLIGFAGRRHSVTVRLMDQKDYPPTLDRIFPARAEPPALVVTAELVAALKRADLLRTPKSTATLTFSEGQILVQAKNETGGTLKGEAVDCDYLGEEVPVGVDPTYLLDGLAALRSNHAELTIATPRGRPDSALRMWLLTAPGEDIAAYRYMIAPRTAGATT